MRPHIVTMESLTGLRLLPSGIVRKNKISIIENGVVVDPWAFLEEIKEIKLKGVKVDEKNLILSESANLILPFHREMDEIERRAGKAKIGTTRGIVLHMRIKSESHTSDGFNL